MNERKLSVTQALIIINVVVFLVGLMVQREALLGIPFPQAPKTSIFEITCAYSWFTCFLEGQLCPLLTAADFQLAAESFRIHADAHGGNLQ